MPAAFSLAIDAEKGRKGPAMIGRTTVAASLATLLMTAAPALAQGGAEALPGVLPGNDATLRDTPGVNAAMPKLVPGSDVVSEGDLGEHQVTGTVSALDTSAGTLVVDVKGKDLQLMFPASALGKLKKGDEVTVTVALHKNASRPN
jgi:hypothetical protein